MNTFSFVISSPDGTLFEGDTVKLSLRGTEGDLAILAGHIPLITPLKPGKCQITLADGNIKRGSIDGGLLMVSANTTILLTEKFQWQMA